jgi:glycosyltransferase involved in cell wall biosynthesis
LSEKIKVIHIITRLDMGGSAQNTLLTALNHDLQRYTVTLIKGSTRESAMTPEETRHVKNQLDAVETKGVKVIDVSSLVRRISPSNDLKAFFSLFRNLQRSKPHIAHTHTSKAGLLGRLAAWLARVPVIVHTPHGHVFYGHFGRLQSRLFLLLERLLGRITHHQIALTSEEAKDYIALRVSNPESTSVVHSGVGLNRFQQGKKGRHRIRKELGIPRDALVVGFVGWLIAIKGVGFLVQAMAGLREEHPGCLLVLVGKGDEKGDEEVKLKRQVESLGLGDKVLFLGWRADVAQIMSCFDLFVLPSLNEGMGRVLVEAMAAGLPIVASRVGGIPDLVKEGKNGLLVPPADAAALERAISNLLQDEARRKRMGDAGKRMCRPYSTEAMVGQIDNLYSQLLEGYSHS